ncbi:MAG: DUF4340 domain-containing protein [Thiohalocapsa sp.]|nr:DUF4340 domain-containing protein [Thiohalocapsa sp.]
MAVSMIKNPVARLDAGWKEALKTPLVLALGALLGVQLLLAAVAGSGGGMEPAAVDAPLLAFEPEDITALEITDAEGAETVLLSRAGDGWVLSALGDFPADGDKVDTLLQSLAELNRPLPAATSADARARFKVADDDFERRLTLRAGNKDVASLIAGDSPGFRRLFARIDGGDAIYDLKLALFDLSNAAGDWMQRDRLQIDQQRITGIAAGDWSLTKDGENWTLDGSDKAPDADMVDQAVQAVAFLGYDSVLGTEDKPEYGQSEPVLRVDVTLDGGETRVYSISRQMAGDASGSDSGEGAAEGAATYVLKSDDSPYYFALQAYMLDGLLDLDRAKLLGEVAADTAARESADGASDLPPEADAETDPEPTPAD